MRRTATGAALAAAAGVLVCSGAMAIGAVPYGFKFGINVAKTTEDADDLDEGKIGIQIGGTLEINLRRDLSLETGLLYTQKGGQGSVLGYDVTYTLDQIEIPALVKYRLLEGKAYVAGGLTIGITVKSELDIEGSPSDDVLDDTEAIELCLALGAGARFAAGGGMLNVGIQYSMGLTDMYTSDYSVGAETLSTVKTDTLSIVATYVF